MKISGVSLEQGFVLGVGDRRGKRGAFLQDGPELIALGDQLGDFCLKVADVSGLSGDLTAEKRGLRSGAEVDLSEGHAARLSGVTAP